MDTLQLAVFLISSVSCATGPTVPTGEEQTRCRADTLSRDMRLAVRQPLTVRVTTFYLGESFIHSRPAGNASFRLYRAQRALRSSSGRSSNAIQMSFAGARTK